MASITLSAAELLLHRLQALDVAGDAANLLI